MPVVSDVNPTSSTISVAKLNIVNRGETDIKQISNAIEIPPTTIENNAITAAKTSLGTSSRATTTPMMLRISIPVPLTLSLTSAISCSSSPKFIDTLSVSMSPSTPTITTLLTTTPSATTLSQSTSAKLSNVTLSTTSVVMSPISTFKLNSSSNAPSLSSISLTLTAIDEGNKFTEIKTATPQSLDAESESLASRSMLSSNTEQLVPQSISDRKQKKTVTFKNILETSDDKSTIKRFYNPDNRKPLVSIIKKDVRNSDCIVKPSRLTEILKRNNNSNCHSSVNNSSAIPATLLPSIAGSSPRSSSLALTSSPLTNSSTGLFKNKLPRRRHSFIIDRLQEQQIYKRNIFGNRRRYQFMSRKQQTLNNKMELEKQNIDRNDNEDKVNDMNYDFVDSRNDCDEKERRKGENKIFSNGNIEDIKSGQDADDNKELGSSLELNDPLPHVFGRLLKFSEQQRPHSAINFPLTKSTCDNETTTSNNYCQYKNGCMEGSTNKRRTRKNKAINFLKEDNSMNNNCTEADLSTPRDIFENEDKDTDNQLQLVVDKHFILPKRSTRSSRVIKPNKRLLENGSILKKVSSKNLNSTATSAVVNNPKELSGKQKKIEIYNFNDRQ